MSARRRKDSGQEDGAVNSKGLDQVRDATLPCPVCGGEMHPMFLYEDREPDVWLCFECGHLERLGAGPGREIPSVDQ